MKPVLTCSVLAIAALAWAPAHAQSDLPPNAKAGECYAKVLVPARYQTVEERVVVSPETTKTRKVPAQYETQEQTLLVQEASFEYVPIPPKYETVQERVLVSPERMEKRVIPARTEKRTERVMISAARVEWKPGRGAFEKIDEATGEIMCRVEIPAKYETITRDVIIEPERIVDEMVPARYETVSKRVLVEPAAVQRREIPAKYETRKIRRLVTPERTVVEAVPAKYRTVNKRVMVADEQMEWRQILCETNTNADTIRRLQRALNRRGYDAGTVDGKWGKNTQRAIYAFQRKEGLPTGGLTLATLQRLGVSND